MTVADNPISQWTAEREFKKVPDKRELRRLGKSNAVQGCPGWYYSVFVSSRDGNLPVYRFHAFLRGTGRRTEEIEASGYRTTTLARKMGEKTRRGYQHAAQQAIRNAR